ncbi:MAG: ATP-binding protein [Acidobacteriota bacterium]
MRRLRLPTVDRLSARIAAGLALLVITPLAAGFYLLSMAHYQDAVDARRIAADLENRLIETALRHQMVQRDPQLMAGILQAVGREPEIVRAMVVDHDGIVKFSSRPAEVGTTTPPTSPTCLVCHAKTAANRQRWVLLKDRGIDVLRSVRPIENAPECHRCHDPAVKLRGMLVLDVSLAQVQARFRWDLAWMGGATGLVTVLMLGGAGWHLRRVVVSRLTRLSQTARAIADGALAERADTSGEDVIADLATEFNAMADATSRLVGEISAREQQMAGVLNSLDDGLIVLDRNLTIVAANRPFAKWMGKHPEMLSGQSCRSVMGHALPCRDDPVCPTARCLATGRLEQTTYRLPASDDGVERVFEVYASPVYTDGGAVGQVVEAWRDITERVREEEHLAEIERLSSLGVLASGLSHEVNTPLAITLTCSESIIDQLQNVDQAGLSVGTIASIRDSANDIREQVLRCRTMTEQFLRFARGIPPSTEPIDLRHVVDSVIALARPTAREAGVDISSEGEGPLPVVSSNTEVVQHVFLNLLVNAIESCPEAGGRIVVRFVADQDIRVQLRDNGCGISPEMQRHLFEPFRTGKPHGTGLGLFLSRTFMRRFHGDVRLVESRLGVGSCIEVVFPRGTSEVSG